jgi:hypothetical protein
VRILIYHGNLSNLTGGEVNTRDWALGLKRRGHRVVIYTVRPGPLAEQIRREGVPVVDDPSLVGDPPDIVFGAGINDVAAVIARFPEVPAIQVAQVYDHWNSYPCPLPQVVLHVAVDERNAEMLVNEFGIARERVRIVHNAVDTARIPPRKSALPSRPARALVLLKEVTPFIEAVRGACAERNIEVEFFGYPVGRPLSDPLAAMTDCDIVIGAARIAIEGAAAGAGVVVADHRGVAGFLTRANLDHLRAHNFGIEALRQPPDVQTIGAAIDAYDPREAAEVGRILCGEASLDRQLDRLEAIFAEASDLFRRTPPPVEESRKALSSYLAKHLPRPAEGDPSPRHARFLTGVSPAERMAAMENRIAEVERRLLADPPISPSDGVAGSSLQAAIDREAYDRLAAEHDALVARVHELEKTGAAERDAFVARIHELAADGETARSAYANQAAELVATSAAERDAFVARIRELEGAIEADRAAYARQRAELIATFSAERDALIGRVRELEATVEADRAQKGTLPEGGKPGPQEGSMPACRQAQVVNLPDIG